MSDGGNKAFIPGNQIAYEGTKWSTILTQDSLKQIQLSGPV